MCPIYQRDSLHYTGGSFIDDLRNLISVFAEMAEGSHTSHPQSFQGVFYGTEPPELWIFLSY